MTERQKEKYQHTKVHDLEEIKKETIEISQSMNIGPQTHLKMISE